MNTEYEFVFQGNFIRLSIESKFSNLINDLHIRIDLRKETYLDEVADNKIQLGKGLYSYLRPLIRPFFNIEFTPEAYYFEIGIGDWLFVSSTSFNKEAWEEIEDFVQKSFYETLKRQNG